MFLAWKPGSSIKRGQKLGRRKSYLKNAIRAIQKKPSKIAFLLGNGRGEPTMERKN